MRFIERLCSPALLYLVFVAASVGLDVSFGYIGMAAVKALVGLGLVAVLNTFCSVNLGIVSWFIVSAPFVVLVLSTAISIGHKMGHPMVEKFTLSPSNISNVENEAEVDEEDLPIDDLPVSTDL